MRFYEPNKMSKSSYEKALNENYERMIENGRSSDLSSLKSHEKIK